MIYHSLHFLVHRQLTPYRRLRITYTEGYITHKERYTIGFPMIYRKNLTDRFESPTHPQQKISHGISCSFPLQRLRKIRTRISHNPALPFRTTQHPPKKLRDECPEQSQLVSLIVLQGLGRDGIDAVQGTREAARMPTPVARTTGFVRGFYLPIPSAHPFSSRNRHIGRVLGNLPGEL